jgi:hypothetical protein
MEGVLILLEVAYNYFPYKKGESVLKKIFCRHYCYPFLRDLTARRFYV